MSEFATNNVKRLNKKLQKKYKITLPSGDIHINDSILLNRNGCWIDGKGASTRLIFSSTTDNSDAIKITADRCMITNVMIIGGGISVSNNAYRTVIRDVYIHDAVKDGVNSIKSSLTMVENCTIERAGRHSIYHGSDSQDPIIINTFTQDAKSDGLLLDYNYGSVITNSHFYRNGINNVKINGGARHRFENCTIDRAQQWGVYIYNANDIILSKCILFDNNQSKKNAGGIKLAKNTHRCLIMQNTIYDDPEVTQKYGINAEDSCTDNKIVYNEVRNSIINDYLIENTDNIVR